MTVAKGAGGEGIMEFGVHLPLLAFRGQAFSLSRLVDYAETAEQLGFTTLCAIVQRPVPCGRHDPARTLSSSGAGRAHLDWQLGIGSGAAPGGSPGRWLARFRLPRHPSIVRQRPGATAPVSASSWEGESRLPTRTGIAVLLCDGGPTP